MPVATVAETILTFAALVCVGVGLRYFGVLRAEDSKPLNAVIVYVGLPAFVFQAVRGAELGPELLLVVPVAWAALLAAMGAAWLVSSRLKVSPEQRGGFIIASALGNTGYLGYPLTAALLGGAAVPAAVFSDVFGTVVALVLIGLPVAQRFGSGGDRAHPVRELLSFPAVIALVCALVLRQVSVPISIENGLELLASLVAPMIMLSVGLSLRPRSLAGSMFPLALLAIIKLLVSPAVAFGLGTVVLPPDVLRVAVLEAGMPSMMLTLVVGERFGLDTEFIAAAVFVTTVAAALTLPAMQHAMF